MSDATGAGRPILRLAGFGVRHRRSPQAAVADVDLTLAAGDVAVVTGGPGSGKTSLLHGLLGVTRSSGEAQVLGSQPGDRSLAGRIGFGPQGNPAPEGARVGELVALVARLRGVPDPRGEAARALARCGLADAAGEVARRLDTEGGRRLSLSLATAGAPALVLLDDPWESPETAAAIEPTLAGGGAVLVTTDRPEGLPKLGPIRLTLAAAAE